MLLEISIKLTHPGETSETSLTKDKRPGPLLSLSSHKEIIWGALS